MFIVRLNNLAAHFYTGYCLVVGEKDRANGAIVRFEPDDLRAILAHIEYGKLGWVPGHYAFVKKDGSVYRPTSWTPWSQGLTFTLTEIQKFYEGFMGR